MSNQYTRFTLPWHRYCYNKNIWCNCLWIGSTPFTNGACTGPNGNVYFPTDPAHYEIDGSAETGTKFTGVSNNTAGHSGSVYAQGHNQDKAVRFDCNANTSINDANVQFTYTLTHVGTAT